MMKTPRRPRDPNLPPAKTDWYKGYLTIIKNLKADGEATDEEITRLLKKAQAAKARVLATLEKSS